MARSLKNKVQVQAPTSTYPFGRIKDDVGDGISGTPVTEEVYGDMHQFFECLLSEASITANERSENEYDGFQYISALKTLLATKTKIIPIGAWNMNASNSKSVAHGIANLDKIRSVSVMIHDDLGNNYFDLFNYDNGAGNVSGGITTINSTVIGLICTAGGHFNTDTAFDDGVVNRGYVTIRYVE